jgi:hypothetical protein
MSRQRHESLAPPAEEFASGDDKRACLQSRQCCERRVNLAFGAGYFQSMPNVSPGSLAKTGSGLVRRLVRVRNDPGMLF